MIDTPSPRGTPLSEALPVRLVESIREQMAHRPADCDDFLSWSTATAVGYDCMRVACATQALVYALGDARDHGGTIDTSGIWAAAAHQCVICAFS